MKYFCAFLFSLAAMAVTAANGPYNETADAHADIKAALEQASAANTPVVVVFGANWCGDCKMLDAQMTQGQSAPLFAKDFKVVHVNVGRFDKNVDLADSYGVPLKKGIPAIAILSPSGTVTYSTKAGELSDARKMGEQGVYDFLKRVTSDSLVNK
jgi:thioredoxin 1